MKLHPSLTQEKVMRACKKNQRDCDSYIGFCIACGKQANNCEPDAREYHCEKCKQNTVYGAEELLMMIV